jgi:hypothetical protein
MSTTNVVYSPKIQNPGKMSQKQLDAIAELKKYYPGLSKDLVINGNLNLADRLITMLPDNLTINGSMDIRSCCDMERLPENLTINGNLYIDSCFEERLPTSIKVRGQISQISGDEIPQGFSVGGDLEVSKFTDSLPDNLTIGGSLDLRQTKIKQLPAGLKVYGNLCLNHLPITSLPADLYVGGNLECFKTSIKNIPESVFIGGGLNISQTDVRILPKQIKEVNGCLHINGCRIKYLPDNLVIHGSLYAEGSALVELPKNLHVDGMLYVQNTSIEELPDDLVVGATIDLRECPIEKLPAGLKVNGSLDISGTLVNELPADIIVNESLYINNSLIEKLPTLVNAGSLYIAAGEVPVDILPENFSVTGDLRLSVYSDGKPEPLKLPANMKVGGDLDMSDSRQKEWPKNLFVGGDVSFGKSNIMRLPTDATIKGKMILYDDLHYVTSIVLRLISSDSDVPYSVVVSKSDLRLSRPIFSSTQDSALEARLRDYPEDKTKVEILPPPVENATKDTENTAAKKKKKDALAKA